MPGASRSNTVGIAFAYQDLLCRLKIICIFVSGNMVP